MGNFTGEAEFLEQQECLAGNPKVYGQMVSILAPHSKFSPANVKAQPATTEPVQGVAL